MRRPWQGLFPASRPLRWALPLGLLLLMLLLQWRAPTWSARAEAWTVEGRFWLRGPETPRFPIVIVAVDEASFQSMGNLQGENIRCWPRSRWAEVVDRIAAAGPRVIGLDVVFDTPCWDEGGDETLAASLAAAGNVVLAANLEASSEGGYGMATYSPPVAPLAEAAAGIGLASLTAAADGAVYDMAVLQHDGAQWRQAFAVVVAGLYSGGPLRVSQQDLGDDLSFAIHFRGPEGTFPTVSLYDVWAGEVDATLFHNAIVLVGYTTQLEQDLHAAPFGGRRGLPGVEIQANAVDTLLAGDWLIRPPAWLASTAITVLGLLALAALSLRRPGLGLLLFLGALAGYLVVGAVLFVRGNFLLPLAAPLATALVVGGGALTERAIFVEREKQRLRQRFAGMMSPERLQTMLENWGQLMEAERPRKEAAVLFADIRGFTSATETMMHEGRSAEMVRFLTAYVDAMAEAVFVEGGVIYDIVGDGLMILFGLPETAPDYALRAVRGAVRMALASEELQAVWPLRDWRPLMMGIGIHCGLVVDAMVGRGRRMKYAVIGDPVNTAARIEAHCKVAMETPRPPGGEVPETITILISADLHDKVREHVLVDESIPPFEARGKERPLQVVRLLGLRSAISDPR